MHPIRGRGTDNPMEEGQEARKPLGQEHTVSGSIVTRYHRLLHRCCVSLDLETTFKQIKISHDIKPKLCQDCQTEKCRCPAFMPEMPCSSVSSMPTNIDIDEEEIPELVSNTPLQVLHPLVQSPSDEEADREVAVICSSAVYYRVRMRNTQRRQYYMYNSVDYIDEFNRGKRRHHQSPHVQGHPVEH